jgi:hypothetical protein
MTKTSVSLAALLLIATTLVAVPALAQSASSVTTKLDLDQCRHIAGKEPEDYGEWRCAGLGGVEVYVAAGDQRSYVSFGPNAKNEPAADETLASFNSEGDSIEWRGERGPHGKLKPFAAIMRWRTTVSSGDVPVKGEVLVVTRLAPGRVCHVGYVDAKANADAGVLARGLADARARQFRCGVDKPVTLGKGGPGFSRPYGN